MTYTTVSERVLVLAPRGRDATIAVAILGEAGIAAEACGSLRALLDELNQGAAVVIVAEEALVSADLAPLSVWIENQEEWSDLPFILLTSRGGGAERNPAARRYSHVLGNAAFVERPFHANTLVSLVQSALRGRRRQYEARARLEALREGEARLRLATENAEIGFWDVDPINDVLIWPPRVKAMFGISAHVPVTMRDFYAGLHPDDREATASAYAAACNPDVRALYDVEYRTIGKEDGAVRWVAAKGRALFDQTGRCRRVVGTAIEVTAKKTIEAALRESEGRLRFLGELDEGLRASGDAPAAMKAAAELLAKRLGASRCAYAAVDVDNDSFIIHDDYTVPGLASSAGAYSLDLFGARAAADMRAGRTLVIRDVRGELPPGEGSEMFLAIGIEAIVCCPLVKNGRLVAMMAVHQAHARDWRDEEIALVETVVERCWSHVERVGAEARLRESEASLRALNADLERKVTERALARGRTWQLSPEIMGVLNVNGYFEQSNPAWERVLGWSEEEVSQTIFFDFIHPDDLAMTQAAWMAATERGEPALSFENRYRTKRGGWRWLSWVAVPDDGKIYCSARDITEEKERRQALAQAEEALRQAQKMEAVGQLTGGVAHDFNNLLTIIRSSIDLMRRAGVPEDRKRQYMDAISDTVTRAAKLTGQLLAFSRRQPLKPEVFDGAERIRSITDMLLTVVGSRIKIEAHLATEPCCVEADASQFETALVNMVVNARDAMQAEGILTIKVAPVSGLPAIRGQQAKPGHFISVAISDTGVGIPVDQLAHIFEPFYTTKEVGKGTGLGLSQVYGFAQQSGGDIAVDSELGKGTTFTLYLPRSTTQAASRELPHAKAHAVAENGQGRRILVVEDNVEVGKFSTQLLRDLGYETTWAADASEALKLLEDGASFHAVFSDVVMPGMSGIELGQEIRRRNPKLPVVLTSGYSHVLADKGHHGFELLQKPYAAEDLSRILRRVSQN